MTRPTVAWGISAYASSRAVRWRLIDGSGHGWAMNNAGRSGPHRRIRHRPKGFGSASRVRAAPGSRRPSRTTPTWRCPSPDEETPTQSSTTRFPAGVNPPLPPSGAGGGRAAAVPPHVRGRSRPRRPDGRSVNGVQPPAASIRSSATESRMTAARSRSSSSQAHRLIASRSTVMPPSAAKVARGSLMPRWRRAPATAVA